MAVTKNSLGIEWDKPKELYTVGRGIITTAYDEINFVIKKPHERVDTHPIQFFPGFTDGIVGADRITNAYAEVNRLAVTMDYPRSENPDFPDDDEGRKAAIGMLVLGATRHIIPDLEEADAQGHSGGGTHGSRACIENPEDFRTFIGMASAGLIKGDAKRKIAARALSNRRSTMHLTGQIVRHPLYNARLAASSADYVRKNPLKADRESSRIGSADIRSRIPVLSKKALIATGALQFASDALFPLDMVLEHTDNGNIFDQFRVYPEADATHVTPQIHPRTTARIVLEMTDELLIRRDELLAERVLPVRAV